jgi:signal transduction histidine kinase
MGPTALEAILINLFTNAVKAIDNEGATDRRIAIRGSSSKDGRRVLLRMSDTGSGIDDSVADSLFDAFVTTRSAANQDLGVGTGLGLKVVSDLVSDYGGSISVVSAENGYKTTFEVNLPRWDEQIK